MFRESVRFDRDMRGERTFGVLGNAMSANGRFQGLRVLVVEDEPLICLLFEDMLQDFGCEILGPACDLASASELAQLQPKIDVAILDVNLSGRPVFPVADILSR